MRDLEYYISEAKIRTGAQSDRRLCEMLGLAQNAIHAWKKKNVLPSPLTMKKLSRLAGIDPAIAIMDLHSWQTKDESLKFTYGKIADAITRGAITLALLLMVIPAPALSPEKVSTFKTDSVYYGNLGGRAVFCLLRFFQDFTRKLFCLCPSYSRLSSFTHAAFI